MLGTLACGAATWLAYQRRGLRSGARWLAVTLLFPAAYFTRTLRMLGRISDAVSDWATSFVWNPLVWVGLGLAGLAALLFILAPRLPSSVAPKAAKAAPAKTRGTPALSGSDPELDEIEALLKRRGIS